MALSLTITNDGALITITGLLTSNGSAFADVDEGNGETITAVTLKVWKGCDICSNCADEEYLNEFAVTVLTVADEYTTNNSGELILNSTTFLQTSGTSYADLSDDVYHIDIYLTVEDDDSIESEQKYTLCTFTDNDLKCKVIKNILLKPENDDLVNIYNAITNAAECYNCCRVCELYEYLTEVLDNMDNCATC